MATFCDELFHKVNADLGMLQRNFFVERATFILFGEQTDRQILKIPNQTFNNKNM